MIMSRFTTIRAFRSMAFGVGALAVAAPVAGSQQQETLVKGRYAIGSRIARNASAPVFRAPSRRGTRAGP